MAKGFQLFVSRLSFYTTNDRLRKLFSPFGLVTEARLVKDPRTQRPKGFGFVTFESEADAQNALKSVNGRIMAEFLAIAQSSIVLPHFRVQAWSQRQQVFAHSQPLRSLHSSLHSLTTPCTVYPNISSRSKNFYWGAKASVVSDATMPTTFTADSAGQGIDILPETGGGGDDSGGANGNSGGGGDNGGNNNNDGGNEGSDEGKDHNSKKKMALSMSQKLTLGYAFLVGAGGFMGYMKSGSTKSLIAGGVSASLLYSVYVMLPTQPVLASSMGFVLSAGLLGVMGSRFLKSKKIFPAGVVSFVSFIMTGGYLHGILRSAH